MPTIKLITGLPGPRSAAINQRRADSMASGNAQHAPVAIDHARGAAVTDVDGNTLLDFAGGIGSLAVGHAPPNVVGAIQAQAQRLIHMCAIVAGYEPQVELAEMLNRITPGDWTKKTTYANSGAEAVEIAVKLARSYTGRPAVMVFEGAYHGRTNLTMAMTSKYSLFKKGFGPFAPEIYRLPFPNLYRKPEEMSEEGYIAFACEQLENALIAHVDPEFIAAIVIEPVLGEGGFLPTPPAFMSKIREICDRHGIVMIADEIQCGFGRTGKLFAMEHYGLAPDLITTGKSLGAGMPIAAVTGRAEILDSTHPGGLGGTYSGNPLACVAAIEAVRTIEQQEFLARAVEVGERMRAHMLAMQARHPGRIGDVRGLGAMLAMEVVTDAGSKTPDMDATSAISAAALERGLIAIRAGLYSNCIRVLPPLDISDEEVEEGMGVLGEAVSEVLGGQVRSSTFLKKLSFS